MEDEFYTVEEVAKRLKVSTKTVRAWITSRQLSAVRAGHFWRIPASALDTFLVRLDAEGPSSAVEETPRRPARRR